MIFADRIITARKKRQLSQKELAQLIGKPSSAISHYENNRRRPNFANLISLADALDCNIDYLLGRTEIMRSVGPTTRRIVEAANKLSRKDLEFLADIAKRLGKKNERTKK